MELLLITVGAKLLFLYAIALAYYYAIIRPIRWAQRRMPDSAFKRIFFSDHYGLSTLARQCYRELQSWKLRTKARGGPVRSTRT